MGLEHGNCEVVWRELVCFRRWRKCIGLCKRGSPLLLAKEPHTAWRKDMFMEQNLFLFCELLKLFYLITLKSHWILPFPKRNANIVVIQLIIKCLLREMKQNVSLFWQNDGSTVHGSKWSSSSESVCCKCVCANILLTLTLLFIYDVTIIPCSIFLSSEVMPELGTLSHCSIFSVDCYSSGKYFSLFYNGKHIFMACGCGSLFIP